MAAGGRLFPPRARPGRVAIGAPPNLTAKPPGSPNGRTAMLILAGELLAELRAIRRTHTVEMARVAGLIINDVLEVRSATFDATAIIQRDFHVQAGSVAVDNLGTHTVWVSSGAAQNSLPPPMLGMTPVPAGSQRIVNVASRVFTIYGTTGETVAWQTFTAGGRIVAGALGAVIGGGP